MITYEEVREKLLAIDVAMKIDKINGQITFVDCYIDRFNDIGTVSIRKTGIFNTYYNHIASIELTRRRLIFEYITELAQTRIKYRGKLSLYQVVFLQNDRDTYRLKRKSNDLKSNQIVNISNRLHNECQYSNMSYNDSRIFTHSLYTISEINDINPDYLPFKKLIEEVSFQ